jgi:hypothetical protein
VIWSYDCNSGFLTSIFFVPEKKKKKQRWDGTKKDRFFTEREMWVFEEVAL